MNYFIFALCCFYAGVCFSLMAAIFLAWSELQAMQARRLARKPRLMACYNSR